MRILILCLALSSFGASAQQTPPQCFEKSAAFNPWVQAMCDHYNGSLGRTARALGKPIPSKQVIQLPAHGSPEAKRTGLSCIGGLAMLRLDNGWSQMLTPEHNYLRCRDL